MDDAIVKYKTGSVVDLERIWLGSESSHLVVSAPDTNHPSADRFQYHTRDTGSDPAMHAGVHGLDLGQRLAD